jgi:hypothetical protein
VHCPEVLPRTVGVQGVVPLATYAVPSRSDPDGRTRAQASGRPKAHKWQGAEEQSDECPLHPQGAGGKQLTKTTYTNRGCPTPDRFRTPFGAPLRSALNLILRVTQGALRHPASCWGEEIYKTAYMNKTGLVVEKFCSKNQQSRPLKLQFADQANDIQIWPTPIAILIRRNRESKGDRGVSKRPHLWESPVPVGAGAAFFPGVGL